MKQIEFTTAEREALQYWRFHHPHPRVQRKMEALYLKSQGLAPAQISRLCAMSKPPCYRYLHEYRQGGIAKLTEVPFHRRQRQLADYRTSIEADFRQRPPASVAEAAARIADLTGLERGPTQVRPVLKVLGAATPQSRADSCQSGRRSTRSFQNRATRTPLGRSQRWSAGRLLYGCGSFCLCPVFGTGVVL